MEISFVPLKHQSDLAMLQSWFQDAELKRRLAFPSESWFEFVTTDPVQRAQIAYESSTPVGFVHYEHESDGRVALAFGVRPDLRGRGYGKRILRAVLASPELASVERVWGGVEPDNVASIRCLTAVGFTSEPYPEEPSMVKMIYHRRPARPAL